MGILTWGDQGQVTQGAPHAALHDLRFVFCSHSDNYSQGKCACTLGMFCCSVRACTDLFNWMAARGAGAGPLPSDHLGGGRTRGNRVPPP